MSKQLERVARYINNYAVPKKLGRVIYSRSGNTKATIKLIKDAGLTPIPLSEYREMQRKQDGREKFKLLFPLQLNS